MMGRGLVLGGALCLLAWGCGSDASSNFDGGSNSGSATSSGSGVGGGFSSSVSGGGGFDACASTTVVGDPIPVKMYIMFDTSGSMLSGQKWAGAKTALTVFFQDEASAGLQVALRFFPDDKPVAGCNESSCNATACATPLVPLGELNAFPAHSDPQQKALVEALATIEPNGQTPMHAALAGATQWARDNAGPDHNTVVVLVTDGDPNGCVNDIGSIAQLAQGAHDEAGVLTYTIGMAGADKSKLDTIAKAGGSDTSFVIKSSTVHSDLANALKKIRTSKLSCSFALPELDADEKELDLKLINVVYAKGNGSEEVIGQVDSAQACSGGGWYYDDPAMPTRIELCPGSCDEVQADAEAEVRVVVGCQTVVK
jgi:hypothetical protein